MPDWIVAVVLGIIEGLTEFIPVSSTGHLLLAEHLQWLPRQSDLFNLVIQCGAVVAVIPVFRDRLLRFAIHWHERETQDYGFKILFSFAITGGIGLILDKKGFKLPENLQPVAWALMIGGILFLLVESWLRSRPARSEITWLVALMVGIGQLVAGVFPGTSRSGATILLALVLGVARPAATEFSFLVGIPTILAASGWKLLKVFRHHDVAMPPENWTMILVATITAAVVSFVAVKWLLRYVQTHTFTAFGWYRLVLGGLALLLAQGW